jgi:hypothetical protein
MPLESHSAEAKDLLATVLTVMLYQPQHWYSPSLPQDHPSSFCCLFGLTCEELNLVMKAFGAVKKGARTFAFKVWFLMITCSNIKAFLPSNLAKALMLLQEIWIIIQNAPWEQCINRRHASHE